MPRDNPPSSGTVARRAERAITPGAPGRGVRRLLHGNVLWLSVVSLLNDTASEMIYPLLPFFLVNVLAASPTFLGVVEGVAESASSLLKLASGWLSDRIQRRKPLIVAGYTIASVARPLIALVTAPWQVLAIRFSDRLGKGARSAPRDALLAESVSADVRGTAFGVHRAADHAGAVLGPVVASVLLLLFADRLRPVFALAAIPGAITVAVVLLRVRETRPEGARAQAGTSATEDTAAVASGAAIGPARGTDRHKRGDAAAATSAPRAPGRAKLGAPLFRYLAVLTLFTLGNASDVFLLLRARDLGIALAAVPLLWAAHNVSKMVWSVPGGMLADRFGPRPAILAGWTIYAATYGAFAWATEAWQVWALFVLYGLFYGLTEAPEKALVAALAPEGKRGSAFGAYHFAIGVAALPASILFGALWTVYGAHIAFLFGAALALAAALLLLAVVPARVVRKVANA